jgi:hypothetical protein
LRAPSVTPLSPSGGACLPFGRFHPAARCAAGLRKSTTPQPYLNQIVRKIPIAVVEMTSAR